MQLLGPANTLLFRAGCWWGLLLGTVLALPTSCSFGLDVGGAFCLELSWPCQRLALLGGRWWGLLLGDLLFTCFKCNKYTNFYAISNKSPKSETWHTKKIPMYVSLSSKVRHGTQKRFQCMSHFSPKWDMEHKKDSNHTSVTDFGINWPPENVVTEIC